MKVDPTPSPPLRKARGGFTLIELMVAVAIVTVLAVVALPSYLKHIARTNRASAESYLLEVSGLQQRYLLDARAYATSLTALNSTPPTSLASTYTFATTPVNTATPPTFTATATPSASQISHDINCGTLTIDQSGNLSASGSAGLQSCWKQ